MSKLINEYLNTKAQLEELNKKLERLENDDRLKVEFEFEREIKDLMEKYNKSPEEMIAFLLPGQAKAVKGAPRKPRQTKVYINPHTGEKVETKGGNNKTIKAWKAEYGEDIMKDWLQ